MNEPSTDTDHCGVCGDAPEGWEPDWAYCPRHGTPLVSSEEPELAAGLARADALDDFDMHRWAQEACGLQPDEAA